MKDDRMVILSNDNNERYIIQQVVIVKSNLNTVLMIRFTPIKIYLGFTSSVVRILWIQIMLKVPLSSFKLNSR